MLASITPLGERSRGFSWNVTATAFAAGAIGAGGVAGAALGAFGSALPGGSTWRGSALCAGLVVTVLFDATPWRTRLPSSRRQVNEDWLARYRGWVYGIGFGAQLGIGIATIVTSAAIYATVVAAVLSSNPATGALIGVTFGTIRALSLLPAHAAQDRDGLVELHRQLGRMEAGVRRAVSVLELLALIAVLGWVS
jgi:hypothetical protein